ncbi:MAG: formylglycine-generating enzyme family protein [Desulfobaccales bacterium]
MRYAPTLAGPKSVVYLSITTNDHDFPTQKLLLTGRGVAPRRELDGSLGQTIANSLGMSFRYLPAGTFLMGSPEHEPGRNDDEVPHEVTLTPDFYLQTTPVTQGQWQVLMGRNPAFFISCGDDCPVEQISWHECREFIKRLNALGEGTYRLPTEAEWEYACRAGSPEAFANGEIATLFCDFDPSLDLMGWYCGNSDRHIHPVAQKHPNAWGIYDMHGNVLEWCQDWYGDYPLSTGPDPLGPKSGSGRVIRGGSWFSSAKTCRSASRFSWSPQSGSHFLGFRLVREI